MKDEIELGEILKQLYAISGILIDVYDLEGRSVARYPEKGAAFCSLVSRTAGTRRDAEGASGTIRRPLPQ